MVTFILYIFLLVMLFSVALLGTIARFFFRGPGRRTSHTDFRTSGFDNADERTSARYTAGKERKKIFDADDGEYVDFEEIKD